MRLTTGVWLNLIVAAASGCAARNPVVVWQERLAQYVEEQGNGDPNVLRDTVDLRSRRAPRPGRITFAALGITGPGVFPFAVTRDVQGVLVGLSEVGAGHWFFFLVGVVKQHPRYSTGLEDVRLLAFTADRTGLHWRVGELSDEALARYTAATQKRERLAAGGGRAATFPAPTDVFQLHVVDKTAVVTELQSGATWELWMGAQEHQPGRRTAADRRITTNQRRSGNGP